MKFNPHDIFGDLGLALGSALFKDLPDIEYKAWTPAMKNAGISHVDAPMEKRRPTHHDIGDVDIFVQMWGSTALGFNGVGGASMTDATTIVINCKGAHAVYFGGRFAYLVPVSNDAFVADLFRRSMVDVAMAKTRYNTA